MRWNSDGDMIASASADDTVKLMDFRAEKSIYTGAIKDGSN